LFRRRFKIDHLKNELAAELIQTKTPVLLELRNTTFDNIVCEGALVKQFDFCFTKGPFSQTVLNAIDYSNSREKGIFICF
jgi:hypothetical protein